VTTIDGIGLALTLGMVAVVPLGLRLVADVSGAAQRTLGLARWASLPAGIVAGASLVLPSGALAAALTVPWLFVGAAAMAVAVLHLVGSNQSLRPGVGHAESAALAFLAVAPVFLSADRLGVRPFGIDPVIVRLTAVHFVFAGFTLPLVGSSLWRRRPGRGLELALGTVVVGIPLTALGFLGLHAANAIGALFVAGGGLAIGVAAVSTAGRFEGSGRRWLMRIAGGSLLLAMPLGATYAIGQFLGFGWIDIATMARLHGTLNALGFALPALVALSLEARHSARPFPAAIRVAR
jgi:hypothetical protein